MAFFNSDFLGTKISKLTTPEITFTYQEKSSAITITNSLSDEEGKKQTSYFEFEVKGNSSVQEEIPYVIYLTKKENTLNDSYVKVYLTKMIDGVEEEVVAPITIRDLKDYLLSENSKKVYNTSLSLQENEEKIDTYRLRAWISDDIMKVIPNKTTSGNSTNVTVNSLIYSFTVNVSTKDQSTLEDNYCMDHGIMNLSNCILQAETKSENVDDAKVMIERKGVPDFSKISPEVLYIETTSDVSSNALNGITYTDNYIRLASSYTFDKTTGIFALKNYTSDEEISDKHIGYYTCWGTESSCTVMYQITEYEIKTTSTGKRYVLRSATRYTYSVVEKTDVNVGLYATSDDDGTSYYYRGNVQNNYVSYAGFLWRIVRRNGDGSIRLIYQGKSASDKANPITTEYHLSSWDPTFVGYKYNKDFIKKDESVETTYANFNENTTYYFGTNYTFDESTERFQLSGETKAGTWEEMHAEAQNKYYYTCFGTSSVSTCPVLLKVMRYVNSQQAKVQFISYSSKSYEDAVKNTTDSNAKEKLDIWYENNILNKKDRNNHSYVDYLSDEIFCNDRSITSGNGYDLAPTTYYGAYTRLASKKTPSLVCPQKNDQFTVSPLKGNGALKYPIALITVDEVAFAGGVNSRANERYYLNFESNYWTMSPAGFYSDYRISDVWCVLSVGRISPWYGVSTLFGLRPVLNLKPDVQIASGNGTILNPYQVELK